MILFNNSRMQNLRSICFISVLVFIFFGCDKDNSGKISGPEIEWISGGTTTTYTYSGGVISGYYFHRSFDVLDKSGEVIIDVQVEDNKDTRVSTTMNVEAGSQYSIKVKGSKSGSQATSPGGKCLNVIFSSPNCHSTQTLSVASYVVSTGIGDTYYCPSSLVFGAIDLVE